MTTYLHMNGSRGIISLENTLAAHSLSSRLCSVLVFSVPRAFALFIFTTLFTEKQFTDVTGCIKRRGGQLKVAAAHAGATHLQAIFGLHLLQFLLSQCFFILFGGSRAFGKVQQE